MTFDLDNIPLFLPKIKHLLEKVEKKGYIIFDCILFEMRPADGNRSRYCMEAELLFAVLPAVSLPEKGKDAVETFCS